MNRRFLVFIIVFTALLLGWHFYLWVRLVLDTEIPAEFSRFITPAFFSLALSIPVIIFTSRRSESKFLKALALIPYLWIGIALLIFTILFFGDIARLFLSPQNETQFARATAVLSLIVGFFGALYGIPNALNPRVKKIAITLKKLPAVFDGFRIVQLTDVHVGSLLKRGHLQKIVDQVNTLKPDLIVITGDLLDGEVHRIVQELTPLKDLSAPHGVYYVTGNHEHFYDVENWIPELRKLNLKPLRSENVRIEKNGAHFILAGVDDVVAGRFESAHPLDLKKAFNGVTEKDCVIFLCHHPKVFVQASKMNVALQLSGHTHGGQIIPFGLISRLDSPFISGLYRRGEAQVYVSQGTGFWGPPMRVGTYAEVTDITLKSSS